MELYQIYPNLVWYQHFREHPIPGSQSEMPYLWRNYLTDGEGVEPHSHKSLVGGWPTPLKNMSSSVGMMTFPIYGKIKNVPNHQPDDLCFHPFCMTCWNIFWKRTGWIEQWYRDLESVARLPYQYIPSQRNEDQRKSAYPPVSSNMAGKAPNQMSI